MSKPDESPKPDQSKQPKTNSRLKSLWSFIFRVGAWLKGKTPHLDKVQSHAETWSGRLGWIAVILGLMAGAAVFSFIMLLSLLPYITVTHTLWVGSILGIAAGWIVYFYASKPAAMVGTASRALWWTRQAVRVGEDLAAKTGDEPVVEPKQSKDQTGEQEKGQEKPQVAPSKCKEQ